MRPPEISIFKQTIAKEVGVAQAIYDNQAEWPDELAFERGEILRVLNERPCANGSNVGINTGWWCCINKDGRRGIVPSNRLRMIHRFEHDNSPQESTSAPLNGITNNASRRRFMFSGSERFTTPFIDDEDDFMSGVNSPPFTAEFINSPSFASDSLISRIFPFSPLERFKHTSLRRMSNGIVGSSPPHGVVRNIPIKVEGAPAKNNNNVRNDGFNKVRSNSLNFSSSRYHNSEPTSPSSTFYRGRFASGGHISPPPASSQQKFFNSSSTTSSVNSATIAGPSPNSKESTISGSDEEHKRLKGVEKTDSTVSKVSNRSVPVLISKFDDRNIPNLKDDDKMHKSPKIASGDSVDNVSWRFQQMGVVSSDESSPKLTPCKNFASKEQHEQCWSAAQIESGVQGGGSSNESESGSITVNTSTVQNDEVGSSSPSSSGIVADINDSNGDSHQRTSATSSLSSCEPSSDVIESSYDTPRPTRTYRSRLDNPLSATAFQDHHHHQQQQQQQPGFCGGSQRIQLGRIRESSGLLMPTLEEKAEPSSTSVLPNVFNCLADKNDTDQESKLNRSVNLDNRSGFVPHLNRSLSIPQEAMFGSAKYSQEDRFKRGESTTSEVATRYRSLDSGSVYSTNDENITRKQAICSKLTENYRHIENGVQTLEKCTAARAWRQPHILQQHIQEIKESVENISDAMNNFLDVTCRIAVDDNNPKAEELKQLLAPLKNSNNMIIQLKQNMDRTGWTLSALSRPRNIYGTTPGSDALDQFLAVIKQLPIDCHKLIQWALVLVPSSSSGARFLTTGWKDLPNVDNITNIYQSHTNTGSSMGVPNTKGREETEKIDSRKQSNISTTSSTIFSNLNGSQSSTPILASRTILDMNNTFVENNEKQNRVTFADDLKPTDRLSNSIMEGHVLEEDDLESVISDRDSIYQETATGGDDVGGTNRRKRPVTSLPPMPQFSPELIKSLSEDDRQLVEFYSPQLDAHTEFLSKAIEEFLTVIEERMPPHEFVQKGKLIILTAHKLIYMADTIAECLSSTELSSEVRRAADRLLDVLKICVQATKHAADEYQSVSAVQSMANCVVTVSRTAYDMKLLVKQCCRNS